jgi:transposase-like protein
VKRVARELGVSRHLVTSLRDFHQIPSIPIRAIDEDGAYQEQQAAIVERLRETGNLAATARTFGVKRERVRRLRALHEIPTSIGVLPERRRQGAREDERAQVAAVLAATGGNVKRAVAETGVAESTVRRWKTERAASWRAINPDNFYANTQRDEETGCLLWTGQTAKGYGVTNLGGRPRRAHRVAYELKYRTTLGAHEHIHHVCRRPSCVETAHLLVVADAGDRGHNALHRLEDDFAVRVAEGELACEMNRLATGAAEWPAWLSDREIGSLQAAEVEQ